MEEIGSFVFCGFLRVSGRFDKGKHSHRTTRSTEANVIEGGNFHVSLLCSKESKCSCEPPHCQVAEPPNEQAETQANQLDSRDSHDVASAPQKPSQQCERIELNTLSMWRANPRCNEADEKDSDTHNPLEEHTVCWIVLLHRDEVGPEKENGNHRGDETQREVLGTRNICTIPEW